VLDIALVFLILLLSLKGYFNGFIRELVGFVGLIGGVFVASRAAEPVGQVLHASLNMGNMALMKLLAFLLVLGVIWGGSSFVATIFTSLKTPPRAVPTQILGMGVAGLKYFLIFSLISTSLLSSALVRDNFNTAIKHSRLLPTLNHVGSTLIHLAPLAVAQGKSHG